MSPPFLDFVSWFVPLGRERAESCLFYFRWEFSERGKRLSRRVRFVIKNNGCVCGEGEIKCRGYFSLICFELACLFVFKSRLCQGVVCIYTSTQDL